MNTFFIRLRLLSPMQIGAGSLGMIEKTLLYIPGKIIWGAFTNSLTNILHPAPDDSDYQQIGKEAASGSISTFFPEISGCRMFPVIPERMWISQKEDFSISFDEMESLILTSSASTAIAPSQMTAERGTLHAIDLIQPFCCCGNNGKSPLCFSGFMQLPESVGGVQADESLIRRVFDVSRIGGGRKRGWGAVRTECVELRDCSDFRELKRNSGILLTAERPFAADQRISGEIRLLSRREFDPLAGSGHRFSPASLVWTVGSMIYDPAS